MENSSTHAKDTIIIITHIPSRPLTNHYIIGSGPVSIQFSLLSQTSVTNTHARLMTDVQQRLGINGHE
jgi:hypothetical protein